MLAFWDLHERFAPSGIVRYFCTRSMIYLRVFKESLLFAWQALIVNRLRTLLSLTGVTIGIFSIISVFTLVDTLEDNIRGSIEELGDNVIFVQKWPWIFGNDYPWWKYVNRPEVALSEVEAVQERSSLAAASAYIINFRKTLKYRTNSMELQVVEATTSMYDQVRNVDLQQGRFITDAEFHSGTPVCVIGDYVAYVLFGPVNPIGKTIKVGGFHADVVGVFEREGESMIGMSMDEKVVLSVNFARKMVNPDNDRLSPILYVKAREGVPNSALKDELTGIMRSLRRLGPRKESNFALNEISILSEGFDEFFDFINLVGLIIGGFSILVGGFGIANIMFVSVKERTHIIGIEKSLGAKNSFILTQFLAEAVLLCLVGGAFGLVIIYLLTVLASQLMDLEVSLSLANIFLGFGISAVIGLLSGFIPALTASRMDPVQAIRAK